MKKIILFILLFITIICNSQPVTITQYPFRVNLNNDMITYLSTFIDGSFIFCNQDNRWYQKVNGVIISIADITVKRPVRVATVLPLPANTYNNGALGFGATLSGNSNGSINPQDGVTLIIGDRLLVNNELVSANNGIYIVTQIGDATHKFILTRGSESDTNLQVFPGITTVTSSEGLINSSVLFTLNTTTNPLIIGTTNQLWQSLYSYGEEYMINNATTTTITSSGTYYKIAGITTTGQLNNFSDGTNNRLVYLGTSRKIFQVIVSASAIQSGGNNKVMKISIFKNGTLIPSSEQQFKNTSTGQIVAANTNCLINLTLNDYIEVFVTNTTDTNPITISYMNINIR